MTFGGSEGWKECGAARSWIRKNSVLVGTVRGPDTWNAVVPSTFTQLPGSARVANGATDFASGAIGNSTTNGFVAGLGGRLSPNAERRNAGPSRPYALPAKPALRMSRLVSIAVPSEFAHRPTTRIGRTAFACQGNSLVGHHNAPHRGHI